MHLFVVIITFSFITLSTNHMSQTQQPKLILIGETFHRHMSSQPYIHLGIKGLCREE